MAALPDHRPLELVDVKRLRAGDLDAVLEEEGYSWRSLLSWDFSASAELVRRFIKMQALNGFALLHGKRPVGYGYYVIEDRKALIGDVYVMRDFAGAEHEDRLLSAMLESLLNTAHVRRVEAQLLMLRSAVYRPLPFGQYLQVQPRNFMMADLRDTAELPISKSIAPYYLLPWDEHRQEEAAQLITRAYEGHVDSNINDQYRTFPGAKRFLMNIVQYPGCGTFFQSGSYLAEDPSGRLAGLCLASTVASDVGHITQVCVDPVALGRGLGYELMRRSLDTLAARGCIKASLTVTAANVRAIHLYQRMGFRALRRFGAFVWEGF